MCDNNPNKRVPNFSSSETELLTSLVKKYSSVLENKITDAVNNKLKEETWQKLAEDFNSTSGIYERSAKTLRAKYENLKKALKRKCGEHRRNLYRTGGGPPPQDLSLTQEESAILELAGPSVEGLPARSDSDRIHDLEEMKVPQWQEVSDVIIQNTNEPSSSTKMEGVSMTSEFKEITISEVNLDSTPSRFLLKRKRSTPLKSRNPEVFNNTMENYSSLSKKKMNLVDAQLRSIENKIAQEKLEHELRCSQLKSKAKQEAREHELKCELMEIEILLKQKELNK